MISFGYVILSHRGHWSHLKLCRKKEGGLLWQNARKKNLISVRLAAFVYYFGMHLGPSPQILCRPLFCLTIPILMINLYRLQGSGTFKKRKANAIKWGFKCHKISPQISWLQMRVLIIIHFHFRRLKISRFPFVWDILEVFVVTYLRFSESVFFTLLFALNLDFAIFARVLKEVFRKFWHRKKRMSPKILVMKVGLLGIIKVQAVIRVGRKS